MHANRRITRLPDEGLREGLFNAPKELIIETVLDDSGLKLIEAQAKKRVTRIMMARHIIHYLLSVNTERTFESIRYIFKKNRGTIIHSRNVVEDMIDTNHEFRLRIIKLSTKIKNGYDNR